MRRTEIQSGTSGGVRMLSIMKEWARRAPKVYIYGCIIHLWSISLARVISQIKNKLTRSQSFTNPVCCIYHKSRPVGESSSESDSSDSSSSESDSDSETDRTRRSSNRQRSTHPQDGPSNQIRREHACSAEHRHKRPSKRRKPSPNAYEKMPRTSKER